MKKLIPAFLAAALLFGCDGTADNKDFIDIETGTELAQTVGADDTHGKTKIGFTASGAWTSSVVQTKPSNADNPGWISIYPDKGDSADTYSVTINLNANGGEERTAVISIRCGDERRDVTVTQLAFDDPTENPDAPKLITRITVNGKEFIDFKYDKEYRVTGYKHWAVWDWSEEPEDVRVEYNFAYDGNTVSAYTYNGHYNDIMYARTAVTLDDAGNAIKVEFTDMGGEEKEYYENYYYDISYRDGRLDRIDLIKIAEDLGLGGTSYWQYQWWDGNMIQSQYENDDFPTTLIYSDKPNKTNIDINTLLFANIVASEYGYSYYYPDMGIYCGIDALAACGMLGDYSANLLSEGKYDSWLQREYSPEDEKYWYTSRSGDIIPIEYAFDAEGYPTDIVYKEATKMYRIEKTEWNGEGPRPEYPGRDSDLWVLYNTSTHTWQFAITYNK